VRIAKSSKEQDGYEAPDTTGARLNSAAPEGAPDANRRSGDKKISKTGFGFKGEAKKFRDGGRIGRDDRAALVISLATTIVDQVSTNQIELAKAEVAHGDAECYPGPGTGKLPASGIASV
jgi:hypothetical protein